MDLRGELHTVKPPLIYRGVEIFGKSYKGLSRFSCKHGGVYRRKRDGKHCFSLVNYGFYINKAFSSASISFMLIFLLTPLDTLDCNYFESGGCGKEYKKGVGRIGGFSI